MNLYQVKAGIRVKTNSELGETTGMIIAQKYLDARQPNKEGKVESYVPGHGGDVWWVTHDDATAAAYCFDEFSPV